MTASAILAYLHSCSEPVPTLGIAKAIGFKTTKDINPTLYELQRGGQVNRTTSANGSDPRWALVIEQPPSDLMTPAEIAEVFAHLDPSNQWAVSEFIRSLSK